jgi:hypothetical protein
MLSFADATGETLAARLRPGNAGANTVTDHLGVLDDAVAQLARERAAGHRPGDSAELVARPVVVRTDSAGAMHGFVAGCRTRNTGFAVVARSNRHVAAATSRTYTEAGTARWAPARRQDGELREGAGGRTDRPGRPQRVAGRHPADRAPRPPPPRRQHSLFPRPGSAYWGHYTDQDGSPVTLDATMRADSESMHSR